MSKQENNTTQDTVPNAGSELDRLSSGKLLSVFSKSPVVGWFFVAIVFHILIIGATSWSYVNDTWIDPEGAEARRQAEENAKKLHIDAPSEKAGDTTPTAAKADAKEPGKTPSTADGDDKDGVNPGVMDESPVESRVTEKATEDELKELERKLLDGDL
ncbi:MAG: hypothetical protein IH991_01010 [Planctomycetes bacterium]|nr:hypothetical protein [Planctomycetota bacterium]